MANLAYSTSSYLCAFSGDVFEFRIKEFTKLNLQFIPDTGHLTVAGENLVDVLNSNYDRITAVHLKDWDETAGRAMQFYSAGFTELGTGDVDLRSVMDFLQSRSYKGWLVVDQSSPERPIERACASRTWLRSKYNV